MISYLQEETFIHKLNPITKIFCLLLLLISELVAYKIFFILFITFFLLVTCFLSHCFKNVKKMLPLILILGFFSFFLWIIFKKTFLEAISMALRLDLMILTGIIFISVTRIEEFTYGLNKLGLSYRVCFALTLAFRLLPSFLLSAVTTLEAQKSRGLNLETKNIFKKVKNYIPLIVPVLVMTLKNAEPLAIALETKGFGISKKRSYYLDYRFGGYDFLALGTIFIISTMVFVF